MPQSGLVLKASIICAMRLDRAERAVVEGAVVGHG
jgi:hypothetical protein